MRLLLLGAIVVVAAGCHPGYTFGARNDSDSLVIVLFGGSSDAPDTLGYAVPAKAFGMTLHGVADDALWRGRVRVVDSSCAVLWEGRIEAGVGIALVAADGRVTWSPTDWQAPVDASNATPRPAIKSTRDCTRPPGG